MKPEKIKRIMRGGMIAAGLAILASCATAPPPPPAPKVTAERRPYPPMGAAPNLAIPPRDATGARATINSGLTGPQTLWNLRSAYNVAALNCTRTNHASLVGTYGDFLKTNAGPLKSVNSALDREYKSAHGSKYIRAREAYQTQVYNYFALPPSLPAFCDAMVSVGQDLTTVPADQLETYSATALAQLENVFLDFFDRYDRYRTDFAQWQIDFQAKYGAPPSDGYFLPGERRVQTQPAPMASAP